MATRRVVTPRTSGYTHVRSRKRNADDTQGPAEVVDLTGDDDAPTETRMKTPKATETPQKRQRRDPYEPTPERRMRQFRKQAPKSCLDRLLRARTQRMYVIGRSVNWVDDYPMMELDVAGTTGNVYKVTVGKVPSCSCPDSLKGNQCKHIFYVLVNALKAPAHLQYQLAFLSTELCEIYQGSPLAVSQATPEDQADGKRKPIEGDCPICFMEFEPDKEKIVWCRAACGNNIHKECFDKWALSKRGTAVRCVYCRSEWQFDNKTDDMNLEQLRNSGHVNHEGYVNVASELGLPIMRDCSTYYHSWASPASYSYGQRSRGRYNSGRTYRTYY